MPVPISHLLSDIGSVVAPVWKKPAGVVGGETLALDDVENVKLRDPKVRFGSAFARRGGGKEVQ